MGEFLHKIIDATIVYPEGSPTLWTFMSGRTKKIIVDFQVLPVTDSLAGDFAEDNLFKERFCNWLNDLWEEKDRKIQILLKENEDIG